MTCFVRRDAANQWRWRLRAANNRIITESGEAYHSREDCFAAVALVKGAAQAQVRDE